MRNGKKKLGVLLVMIVMFLVLFFGSIAETNNAGFYKIKQAAIHGKMTVHNLPGMFLQMFGNVFKYKISDEVHFSNSKLDGGAGEESLPVNIRFTDGGTARISGVIKYRLNTQYDHALKLHEDFSTNDNVKYNLIRQTVVEALMQTGSLFRAEETYSSKRSEFTSLVEAQIRQGIFDTEASEVKVQDVDGNEFINRIVRVKYLDGKPIVKKVSPLKRYSVEILQFTIKEIDFDDTIDKLIATKKEAEQKKMVAKSMAEKSKQDAITALEKGKADIAKARAEKEVEKIQAVTTANKTKEVAILKAEQEFAVAVLDRKKAEENAKALLVNKKAQARANALLVKSGLTPQEKAEWDYKRADVVSKNLSNINVPNFVISGGNSKGGVVDPFTAIGLESLMNINKKLMRR